MIVFAAIALLATAGALDLLEPTEARYAQIAQEMLRTGDFATPHLNGLAYYHKPPFAYWTVAASFAAFGESARSARIPVALATLGAYAHWQFLVVLAAMLALAGALGLAFTASRLNPDGVPPSD